MDITCHAGYIMVPILSKHHTRECILIAKINCELFMFINFKLL